MADQSKPLIKTKYNYQTKGINKVTSIILIVGAVIAITAPFLHIFFVKDSIDKFFGFRNIRVFLYIIGQPIVIFVLSLFLSFISNFIENKDLKKIIRFSSYMFTAVAFYFLIWIFWNKQDLHAYIYYTAVIILSIIGSYIVSKGLKKISDHLLRINRIEKQIPELDNNIKQVNEIAKIMPSDNVDIITYKAMIDVTGDQLNGSLSNIKKELGNE
ncbi:hypothetical protein [Aquimarina rhabdastrellae]